MKKILPLLIPISFIFVLFLHGKSQGDLPSSRVHYQEGDLKPTETQKKVERLVFGILSNYHYRKIAVNDSLSSKIYDAYLKELDPNKVFFIAIRARQQAKLYLYKHIQICIFIPTIIIRQHSGSI